MDKHNWTTRTFHRTLHSAFPQDHACAIEHHRSVRRIGGWGEKAVIALAIVACGLWIAGVV